MTSWWPIVLLALAGFFIGGVYSFAKTKRWFATGVMAMAAALCLVGAALWWTSA